MAFRRVVITVALLAAVVCGSLPSRLSAQTRTSGVLLYDPVPMDSADPYAIQPNGYFAPVQPLSPMRSGFSLITNPVPYRGRMFLRGEYLGWMLDPMNTPVLATTSRPGTPQAQAGVLGNPATSTLFGGEINDEFRHGFRVQGGWYVDPSRYWGIGGDYYQLFNGGESFSASTADNPIIGRPFYDIVGARERANLVSFPGVANGDLAIDTDTKLRSFGIHIQADAINSPGAISQIASDCAREPRLDWIIGYRNVRLEDRIAFTENITSLLPPPNTGTLNLNESFKTENSFQGIEIGAVREVPFGRFWFETVSKVALGSNAQKVMINGSTVLTEAGVPATYPGGLLTQRSNIGTYERNQFCLVPELGATLGFHVTPRFSVNLGYSFVYISNVVRAGDQIDRDLNPGLIPIEANPLTGPLRPQFLFRQADFFAHGVTAGADLRF